MDSFSKEANRGCIILIVFTFVITASIIIGSYYYKKNNNIIETGVELQKRNDSLKIEVNNLDSIKNAKVIEVKTLDNDSTIKLFYKLIK
nr:MAG TPA: hypothetical protein [Crassvirales sp.]